MKLRRKELCPIHRSFYYCGREPIQKGSRVGRFGVERIEDPTIPGDIENSAAKAEMRKLLNRKIVEQDRECAICQVAFTSYSDIVPDHIDPRGMGGSRRDDHPENIQAVHFWCNGERDPPGSLRDCQFSNFSVLSRFIRVLDARCVRQLLQIRQLWRTSAAF